jgi:hypothetical protein
MSIYNGYNSILDYLNLNNKKYVKNKTFLKENDIIYLEKNGQYYNQYNLRCENSMCIDKELYDYLHSDSKKHNNTLIDIYENGVETGKIYSTKQLFNNDKQIKSIYKQNKELFVDKNNNLIPLKKYVKDLYDKPYEWFINDIEIIDYDYLETTETIICSFIGNLEIGICLLNKILKSDKKKLLNIIIINSEKIYDKIIEIIDEFENKIVFLSKQFGNDIIPTLQALNYINDFDYKHVIKLHTKSGKDIFNQYVDYLLNYNINEIIYDDKSNTIGYNYLNLSNLYCKKLINSNKSIINSNKLFVPSTIFLTEKKTITNILEFIEKNNYKSYFLNNMYDPNHINIVQSPIHFLERLFGVIEYNTEYKEIYNLIGLLGINCSTSENVILLKNYLENNGHCVNLFNVSEINKVKNSKNNIVCMQPFECKIFNICSQFKYKPSVLWVWEFKSLPNIFEHMEKYYKEIITVSDFCLEVFNKNLSIPVRKIKLKSQIHNYLDKITNHEIEYKPLKTLLEKNKNKKVYGYCFDLNSSIIRKNVLNLVKAFSKTDNDEKILILKTRPYRYQPDSLENSIIHELYNIIDNNEHIHIINNQISILDLYKLYTYFDYYISPHCGEGYGLTIYDNMILGNKIISPYYSGETEYLNRDEIIELEYEEQDIPGLQKHSVYGQMKDYKAAYISVESIEKCLTRADTNIFVIDCQPLQHERRGIGMYGVNLVNNLIKNYSNKFSFHLIINNFLSDELINNRIIKQETNTIHKINFENIENHLHHERNVYFDSNEIEYEKTLADYINNLKPKYFLNLSEFDRRKIMINMDLLNKNIRTFSILHDLIPLKQCFYDKISEKWTINYDKQLNNLKKYDNLLSNSEFTKKDCSDVLNNIETIGTIVNDYKYSFSKEQEQSVLKKFNINKKYIYCQTAFGDNKRLIFLYQQYLKLSEVIKNDILLVLGSNIPKDYIKKYNMNDKNVIITGYLSEGDLHILHENAWLFVFPSSYEGFGIPPVEAMKHNKPVIVANNTSLVEVIGNDKFMFNHDEKSCSDLITNLYRDHKLYNECVENSVKRKDLFNKEKVLDKFYSKLYLHPSLHHKKIKISIILVLHNNLEWFNYLENKINIIKKKFNYDFDFYIYENNSNIEFKNKLKDFMKKSKGKLLSENTKSIKYGSIISKDRAIYMGYLRNKNKINHGHLYSDYIWLLDSNVYFDDDILFKFINGLRNDNSLCSISSLCLSFNSRNHLYDSLAFIYGKYNYRNTDNTCLMKNCRRCITHRKIFSKIDKIPEEDLIVPGSKIYPECAFCSHCLIKTEIYNKVKWTDDHDLHECEWFGFFKNIRRYGRHCLDTNIISKKNNQR